MQADLTADLNNWVREGDKVQWFFAGHDVGGHLYLISLLENISPAINDEQLDAVTAEGSRRSVPALGINFITPISPHQFFQLRESISDAHSFVRGPRIGTYENMGIPEYVEIDGVRYEYAGIAPGHAWKLNTERHFVTDGLLFEHKS